MRNSHRYENMRNRSSKARVLAVQATLARDASKIIEDGIDEMRISHVRAQSSTVQIHDVDGTGSYNRYRYVGLEISDRCSCQHGMLKISPLKHAEIAPRPINHSQGRVKPVKGVREKEE